MANEIEEGEEARIISSLAALSLPPRAVHDLLAIGVVLFPLQLKSPLIYSTISNLGFLIVQVCVRCIFRLFGVQSPAYSSSLLTPSILRSFFDEQNGDAEIAANGVDAEKDETYCSVCLGILELVHQSDRGVVKTSAEGFALKMVERVKEEGYQIDGLSLEISTPQIIAANERALRLHMKKKYEHEEWFKDTFLSENITVKDALRSSITGSLEKHLEVKSGQNYFHIRLTYTHYDSSAKLQEHFGEDHFFKKRKIGTEASQDSNKKCSNEQLMGESEAAILRTLNNMQDHVFTDHFVLPPAKVSKPCQLTITCHRMPIYIGGRYLKFSRKVSQSRWIIDDERMGEASVEEIIGSNTLSVCRGDNYKFHAAGREDIDVRMLGSGRPFLIEVSNARCTPSVVDVQQLTDTINNLNEKYVMVRSLKVVGSEVWALMREGEAEKQKQYVAVVWTSRPVTEDDVDNISSIKDMEVLQRTPIRVLHRRSPLERKRIIHWMKVEKISGSCHYFLLHLCTQAGTYIKEFVHGDLGRTYPSVGSILGCKAEILQLDVTDVKMDFFD